MSDLTSEKTIRSLPFSGKQEDWRMWSRKFLARAELKGYQEILEGTKKAPSASLVIDESTATGKRLSKLRRANTMAYNDLLMACEDEVSFGAVDEALTKDLPKGDARQAWLNLQAKYESTTAASKKQLKKEFHTSSLNDVTKDPDEWITNLERMRIRLKAMKHEISDEDLMIHVLNNLPEEYDNLVEDLEDRIEASNDPLTIKTLRERLRMKYERIMKRKNVDENALIGQFKGTCRVCGKMGHKGYQCPDKNKNANNKTQQRNGTQ